MARELLDVSRRRKRRWALIKISSWTSIVFLGIAAGVSFFYIPSLRASSITFTGLETLNETKLREEVSDILSKKYFLIFPKNNIVFLPRKEILSLLAGIPRLEGFSIETGLPSKLEIKLKERKSWAVWCRKPADLPAEGSPQAGSPSDIQAGKPPCALVDKNGFVFAAAPIFSGSAVLKILDGRGIDYFGKNFIAPEKLNEISLLGERLEKRLGEEISAVEITNDDEFHLVLKNGWYLKLDFATDLPKAFDNLALILENLKDSRRNLEYIDLRFQDKVFYKLKK
ncbi:MAG: cell division protein FtsQ/DivIB [bacterium]|nr:cell division protein FtsQ/DivIB [bacterium]